LETNVYKNEKSSQVDPNNICSYLYSNSGKSISYEKSSQVEAKNKKVCS
jgi:hypothetical protein